MKSPPPHINAELSSAPEGHLFELLVLPERSEGEGVRTLLNSAFPPSEARGE